MLPSRTVEALLQKYPRDLQDLALELRSLIASIAPDVTEVRHGRGFSYYYKERGGPVSAGVCQIILFADHVCLAFIHGAFLPDPKELLQGESLYKRFVHLDSYESTPWEDLKDLIIHSSRFDPYTQQFS
jgi:hypothetical protein